MKKKRPAKKDSVTREQSLALMARFAKCIFWNWIGEVEATRALAFSPEEFGRRITAHIVSGLGVKRKDFKLNLEICSFEPVRFFGKGYSFWRGPLNRDGLKGAERVSWSSNALREINFEDVHLVLCSEQEHVSRAELKLDKKRSIILGGTVFVALIKDYNSHKAERNKILWRLYHQRGIRRIQFAGDVIRNPEGRPNTLFMQANCNGEWQWGCEWAFLPAFLPKSKLPIKKVEPSPKMKAVMAGFMGPRRGLVYPGL